MTEYIDDIVGDDIDWEYAHEIDNSDLIEFEFNDSIESDIY